MPSSVGEDQLFFVLSNEDRLAILSEVSREPLRLTQIAKKLSTTVQETSRHLERLSDARIVERDQESSYRLTSLGKMVLSLLPSFGVLRKESAYFLSHDSSLLPQAFIRRIGELSECDSLAHVEHVLAYAEKVIEGADEYLAFMSDQPVFHHPRSMKHPERLSVRLIFSRDLGREVLENTRSIWAKSKLEIRLWQNASLGMVMNEKIAGICLPALDGKLDLTHMLAGKTAEFHGWCHDLFESYWDKLADI